MAKWGWLLFICSNKKIKRHQTEVGDGRFRIKQRRCCFTLWKCGSFCHKHWVGVNFGIWIIISLPCIYTFLEVWTIGQYFAECQFEKKNSKSTQATQCKDDSGITLFPSQQFLTQKLLLLVNIASVGSCIWKCPCWLLGPRSRLYMVVNWVPLSGPTSTTFQNDSVTGYFAITDGPR